MLNIFGKQDKNRSQSYMLKNYQLFITHMFIKDLCNRVPFFSLNYLCMLENSSTNLIFLHCLKSPTHCPSAVCYHFIPVRVLRWQTITIALRTSCTILGARNTCHSPEDPTQSVFWIWWPGEILTRDPWSGSITRRRSSVWRNTIDGLSGPRTSTSRVCWPSWRLVDFKCCTFCHVGFVSRSTDNFKWIG